MMARFTSGVVILVGSLLSGCFSEKAAVSRTEYKSHRCCWGKAVRYECPNVLLTKVMGVTVPEYEWNERAGNGTFGASHFNLKEPVDGFTHCVLNVIHSEKSAGTCDLDLILCEESDGSSESSGLKSIELSRAYPFGTDDCCLLEELQRVLSWLGESLGTDISVDSLASVRDCVDSPWYTSYYCPQVVSSVIIRLSGSQCVVVEVRDAVCVRRNCGLEEVLPAIIKVKFDFRTPEPPLDKDLASAAGPVKRVTIGRDISSSVSREFAVRH